MTSPATAVASQLLDPLLPEDFFRQVVDQMELLDASDFSWDSRCGRAFVHNHASHVALHDVLVPIASELAGRPVKKSYAFATMYGEGGVVPRHTDRAQCAYTIDLCVSQREPWGLFVDDVEYLLEPNQALFFSGTGSPHHRDPIQPGNFCSLVLFHFVEEEFEGPLD